MLSHDRQISPPGGQVNDTRIFFQIKWEKNEMKEEKKIYNKTKKNNKIRKNFNH